MAEYLSIEDFNYDLPEELIAQQPASPRDHSRLMVLNRAEQSVQHHKFYEISQFLQPGDLLVVNNSKVIKARLHATKPTGGKVEIFLLRQMDALNWECLIGGRGMAEGVVLNVGSATGTLQTKITNRTWQITFDTPQITDSGEMPLPPYITQHGFTPEQLEEHYQTVYAETEGSVAAPTAGLHFTDELLHTIQANGVNIAEVTLHVGLGTFAPVKTDNVYEHEMHAEFGILPPETAAAIAETKAAGGRVIAVGTTATRTLEAFHGKTDSDWIDLFITPGYTFNTVDALITNFHLPKSTLLMLVGALAGKQFMDTAYQAAIDERYRFYSFGDAMFIQ